MLTDVSVLLDERHRNGPYPRISTTMLVIVTISETGDWGWAWNYIWFCPDGRECDSGIIWALLKIEVNHDSSDSS